jgi:hypothetical protein
MSFSQRRDIFVRQCLLTRDYREPRLRRSASATRRMRRAVASRNSKWYGEQSWSLVPDRLSRSTRLTMMAIQNTAAMDIQCQTCKATFLKTTREKAYDSASLLTLAYGHADNRGTGLLNMR